MVQKQHSHPFSQLLGESLVDFKPSSIKTQAQRSPIGVVVPIEVMVQKPSELSSFIDIRTGGDQVATRQSFIESGIITSVQFIDGEFPDRVASGGTIIGIAMAFVRHSETRQTMILGVKVLMEILLPVEQSVRPHRYPS